MGDIPTYEPQAVTRPLPTPYAAPDVSPDALGAASGAGLQQLGGAVEQITQRAKANADAAQVMGAIGQSRAALNNIILDPRSGYASQKGDDAIANRDAYLQNFNEALDKAGSTLTNPEQRRAFQQHALYIREEAQRHVLSHESMQIEDVARAKYQGAADETMRTMHAVIGDPDELDKQMADLRRLATVEAVRRFGRSPEAVQAVVGPEMQKGALEAMNAAMATENPAVVASTFQKVAPYLGQHEHTYQRFATAIAQKTQINTHASTIVGGAVEQVAMPDGTVIPRVDSTKLAAGIAALPPETLNLAEIQKVVEQREQIGQKLWNQSVATVVQRIQSAGTDPTTGAFDLSSPRVAAQDRSWLQQFAPKALIDLRALDARAQRANNAEDRQISAGNYNNLTAQLIDQTQRKAIFGQMTPAEFQAYLLDDAKFPGGFTDADQKKALQQFQRLKNEAGKLEEPVPKAVSEVLRAAFPNDANGVQQKKYTGMLHDAVQEYVDDYKLKHKGVAPDSSEVRKFAETELAKGSVTDVGKAEGFFDLENVRRVEFQRQPQYRGKQFNPAGGAPAEVRGATKQDLDALDWLHKNPNDAAARGVRARLKSKGLL